MDLNTRSGRPTTTAPASSPNSSPKEHRCSATTVACSEFLQKRKLQPELYCLNTSHTVIPYKPALGHITARVRSEIMILRRSVGSKWASWFLLALEITINWLTKGLENLWRNRKVRKRREAYQKSRSAPQKPKENSVNPQNKTVNSSKILEKQTCKD